MPLNAVSGVDEQTISIRQQLSTATSPLRHGQTDGLSFNSSHFFTATNPPLEVSCGNIRLRWLVQPGDRRGGRYNEGT